jgi:folate-binding protein YgfZ
MTLTVAQNQPTLANLPLTYAVQLSDFSAISLSGEEQSKYLQGQVTCDVDSLSDHPLLFGAHCDAKGKVFSCFRLFNREGSHLLFQPKSTIKASLAELKKFGVFAKVSIEEITELTFIAIVGEQAHDLIYQHFAQVPDSLSPVIQVGSSTIVYLAGSIDRYIIIDEQANIEKTLALLKLPTYSSAIWTLLEINQGIPQLGENSIGEYVPQMLNLQAINGISFTKGCYLGQETVARMQYLGKNKKALFSLTGKSMSEIDNLIIEKQLGENWRKAGDITSIYQAEDKSLAIQAVLANDTDSSTKLRIKDQPENTLSLCDLPYQLNQD